MDLALETIDEASAALELAELIESGNFDAKSVREMLDLIPGTRRIAVAALFRCLGARKWYFVKGNEERQFEADYKTQLAAAQVILSYQDGLPVQTTLAVNVGSATGSGAELDLGKAIQASPALRQRLEKLVGPKAAG
jgi:hypothetical protein